MTTTDPQTPRPAGSHAAGEDELDRGPTNDTTGTAYEAGFADAEPAGPASAGPTASGDGPVLLPVDPPEDTRFDDSSYDDRAADHTDRTDDSAFGDRGADDRADDRPLGDRADDVLPGEDRPADRDDSVFVAGSDHTDGLPSPTPSPAATTTAGDAHDFTVVQGDHTDGLPTPAADPSASGVTSSPVSGSSRGDADWHELQSKFVDDPAAAVRDAGALVERALSDLRGRLETGDTEALRTAFKRYRDLHSSLS